MGGNLIKIQSRIIHPDRVHIMTCNEIWSQACEEEEEEEEDDNNSRTRGLGQDDFSIDVTIYFYGKLLTPGSGPILTPGR